MILSFMPRGLPLQIFVRKLSMEMIFLNMVKKAIKSFQAVEFPEVDIAQKTALSSMPMSTVLRISCESMRIKRPSLFV